MHKRRHHPGELIKALMQKRGPKSAAELARLAGVRQPTLHRILAGESADPKNENLAKIARHYRVTVSQLRGEQPLVDINTEPAPDVSALPLISWVQAGRGKPPVEIHTLRQEAAVYTTKKVGARAFALRVRGDSMESPAGRHTFPEGCIIIVDPDKAADVGSYVCVRMPGAEEATFKQLVEDAGVRYLKPLNPRYPMLPLPEGAELCGTWVQTIIDPD